MASLVDVMPSILSLSDIPAPSGIEGCDLCPTWRQTNAKLPERFVFAEADHNNVKNDIKRAVRHHQYKLHYDLLSRKHELYDLVNDPHEHTDVSYEHPAILKSLIQALKKFMGKGIEGKTTVPLSQGDIEKLKSLGYL
jgi:arylsulfatase A-like enzyme